MKCKTCFSEKNEADFYVSNKSRCKDCLKKSAIANRLAKIDYYRAHDRFRGGLSYRVKARKEYAKTDSGKAAQARSVKTQKLLRPKQNKAREIVNNAVRDGRLEKWPCLVCGVKAEAHHPDYDRPLDVVWLCNMHHRQAHEIGKTYKEAAWPIPNFNSATRTTKCATVCLLVIR